MEPTRSKLFRSLIYLSAGGARGRNAGLPLIAGLDIHADQHGHHRGADQALMTTVAIAEGDTPSRFGQATTVDAVVLNQSSSERCGNSSTRGK